MMYLGNKNVRLLIFRSFIDAFEEIFVSRTNKKAQYIQMKKIVFFVSINFETDVLKNLFRDAISKLLTYKYAYYGILV